MNQLELSAGADFHTHLRSDKMMKQVVPSIRLGGCSIAYVMPNLIPPVTTVDMCMNYKRELEALDPETMFLMSLYLSPEITPKVIEEAKAAGIIGVKAYPRGVTTNSQFGIESYEQYYPTFSAMEKHGLVLNIHGEEQNSPGKDNITVLTAEQEFLPTLLNLHAQFPKLKIVLEHCTSAASIEAIKSCGDNVAGTITAHHLFLTVDDWAGNPYAYCKPVAKLPSDRKELLNIATSGNKKFFLGSDSAPHPQMLKINTKKIAAGIFTQPYLMSYLAEAFDSVGKLDKLENFACIFGREFYNIKNINMDKKIILTKQPFQIPSVFGSGDIAVVPFLEGKTLNWTVKWK
ncbi:hypothetical protein PORY_002147 [Pneumocystis oryctolagi]|uniref:Uncharacterized protein n=1 Tax=Pneumocystis oryctolagi TaxID=42067 RepID=A0ACB7CD65_9ASCO|nr:hypothetical protein PORY_002147 [Pneumocystis oryctolagi]